ncbi:protein kinase domain-containing protein [Paludibaculum fermentans]|uniref:protein kinase domain-containing protein n=1 Tax=Paludibaculum fermentans TaxID=1473598 RepID=UPI003EB9D221
MSRRPSFYWWVIVCGVALTLCFAITGVQLWQHAKTGKDYGFGGQTRDDSIVVTAVAPGGPVDGKLRVGDIIRKVNGYYGPAWLLNHLLLLAPHDRPYTLTVVRQGQPLDLPLRIANSPARGPVYWGFPLQLLGGVACLVVAMMMGLSRPGDRTVQFACLSFLALAAMHFFRILAVLMWFLDPLPRFTMALLSLADPLPLVTGFLFAERFPAVVPARAWWRYTRILVCAAVTAQWLSQLPNRIFSSLSPELAVPASHWLAAPMLWSSRIPHVWWKSANVLLLVAIAVVILRNYRAVKQPDLRRRIRWAMLGIVLAIVPLAVLYGVASAFMLTGRPTQEWLGPGEELSFGFVGLAVSSTIGYGVLQHRLLDIHLAIRRSIQYLFAKRVLQAAISLPVVLILAHAAWDPRLTVRDLFFGSHVSLALMAVAILGLLYRRPLLLAVDRRFFREAHSQEKILRSLVEEIGHHDSIGDVSKLVSVKVEEALHPLRVLVFCRSERRGDFSLGHSSAGVEAELRVSATCGVLRLLEESPRPREFPVSGLGDPDMNGAEYFQELGVRLMVPIMGIDRRLVGILMLGEKLSESPYTAADRDLLQAIAGQIGVVYENIALRESVRREARIKRNVLAHLDGTKINLLQECPRCGTCFDRSVNQCGFDGAALELTVPVERIVDGVYRLDRRIGTGAMGAVYRSTDLRLGRTVAVKLMTGSLFGNPAALRRFEREARAVARLSHPNIVAIYDFGGVGSDGAYLVMEMIEGITLRAELQRAGRLKPELAAARFDQLMSGLEAAQLAGVVHRDLKPENLIIARLGDGAELLKILDFGLAKICFSDARATTSLTMAGAVVGTLGYMSPEQLLGEEVDERTDTFSVGVLVVEALTGRRPFVGQSFQELLHATLYESYRLPGADAASLRLNAILDRCLAKRREDRPRIGEVRRDLVDAMRAWPEVKWMAVASNEERTIDATGF